jgi:hypothetical protein
VGQKPATGDLPCCIENLLNRKSFAVAKVVDPGGHGSDQLPGQGRLSLAEVVQTEHMGFGKITDVDVITACRFHPE